MHVAVIGAGSWGTALAIQFARAHHDVALWARDAAQRQAMQQARCNARYLPDAPFPASLRVATSLQDALSTAEEVLVAAPSHALREVLTQLKPDLRPGTRLSWATKGFELNTGKLPHQVARDVLGDMPMAVLSGPTFAREVGAGLPTALTVAASDADHARVLAQALSVENFRAYTSDDMVGVEVGGAIKNVLAIGAAISDGLQFGANTRIALITRGLQEMTRLGVALGGRAETFMGLAGLGDLVLTCTDNQSRNRRFGLAFAAGKNAADAQRDIGQVVEGYGAALAVKQVAEQHQVDMPICQMVYRMLYENLSPQQAVKELMSRRLKAEHT